MEVNFTINGKKYSASPASVSIDTTLNNFIRNHAKLTGTKFMCLEGGCGACIVTLKGVHPVTKKDTIWAVNSCLQNIYSCHGLEITTVEGIGSKKEGMHKVQKRLADFNGTQCGFCTPGMVMNMFSLLESKNGQVTMEEVENSFGGNICRCTGYRPILDAFKSLATNADPKLCRDIEDCGTNQCKNQCKEKCKKSTLALHFSEDRKWFKVFNIDDVFKTFVKAGNGPYMLVNGNTAHGVYRRSPDLKTFIDISDVEELRSFKLNENSLTIGGNVTLTECMEIFTKVANENKNFSYLHEIVKHIDLIANVPVRNNGTLAGNLMIKNAHNEFPSDIFITFEAAGALINILSSSGFSFTGKHFSSNKISPKDFISTNMDRKIITKIILPSYDASKFIYRSYKIMPRAQNAHAYVNAAFLLQLDDNQKVSSAKICFGGINPKFVHASNTETFLIGEDPFEDNTIQRALTILKDELKPDWILPDASVEYRQNLALALFYKFILNVSPDSKTSSKFKSGGEILKRDLSSGTQTFDTYEQYWPLTKNIPKIEADVQCTGEAKYINDFSILPDELHAAFATSKNPGGVIESIDASKTLKIPGVVAFLSAKDIPGANNFTPPEMEPGAEAELIFAETEVLFHNQPIGVILAETMEIANYASNFVEVTYKHQASRPEIFLTLRDVLEKAPQNIRPHPANSRAAESQGTKSAHKITGRFEIGLQYHFTMETQTCLCIPIEDGMDVYSSTQWIDLTQMAISDMLSIPNSHLNMHVRRLGGGYGGKISRATQIACATALGAFKLNRPVRFVMQLEANMNSIGKRYACLNDYDIEIDANGKIQKLTNDYVEDYGCSKNEAVTMGTTEFFFNCYDRAHFTVNAKEAKTNSPSNTWCRAPGTLEGIAMIENIMEHIAMKANKDPLQVRLENIPQDSDMRKYLADFEKSTDYYNRKKAIDEFNANNRWIKRGIGIVPMKYPLGYFGVTYALVSVYHGDGSVSITIGGIEMGQGLFTKVAQTAGHVLGVSLDKISVKPSNSHAAPNAVVTGGSTGSDICSFAVQKACEEIVARLKPVKDKNPDLEWSKLIGKAYGENVDLCEKYFYKPEDIKPYIIWGASCCEMEVDLLTGNILVKRVDIMEDVGESMSPGIDIGQIEGGFVMALGYWLTESIIYDQTTGELLTNRTWNYKPPGAKDIPIDFRINFLKNSSNPFGVLRSKATGEPSTAMAFVAVCALRHALNSARRDAGITDDEFYHLGAPSTSETIFLAAKNNINQFLLK